ncbi:MAG: hypothetical protein PHC34_06455 [Candidatus Gastranaerophilales bacterium]|nr:hypothetical protein [Candidatus Gastranaerophilales bacterium]
MKIDNRSIKINPSKMITAISKKVERQPEAQKPSNNNEHFNEFYSHNNPDKKPQETERIKVLPGEPGYNLDIKV